MAGETILIVDDNADVRILLGERVLPSYGYRTLTATDGQEGLWQIRTQKPDLILLDLRLPDMTGLDLLHILSSEGFDAPVILITAYGSELIAAQALRLGVRDYIIKPFTLDEIVESVERALIEQRLRRERNSLTDRLQHYTAALNALADVGKRVVHHRDPGQDLCRLLEAAVSATQSLAGRFWTFEPEGGFLSVRVAQDGVDQPAFLLGRREEVPQVEEAFSSGVIQRWVEEVEDGTETHLAVPVFRAGQAAAVLEVHLPGSEISPGDFVLLVLRVLAGWAGIILDRAHLGDVMVAQEEQIRAFGALSRDLLVAVDAQDCVTAVTPAVETMMGHPPEAVVGQDLCQWIEGIASSEGEFAQWYGRQAAGEDDPECYALFFHDSEGEPRHAEVEMILRQGETGPVRRYVLFREVTSHGRLEQ